MTQWFKSNYFTGWETMPNNGISLVSKEKKNQTKMRKKQAKEIMHWYSIVERVSNNSKRLRVGLQSETCDHDHHHHHATVLFYSMWHIGSTALTQTRLPNHLETAKVKVNHKIQNKISKSIYKIHEIKTLLYLVVD